jgi:predicted DNA-binding transcriptional regulator AlpA
MTTLSNIKQKTSSGGTMPARRHHLDQRADQIIAAAGGDDDLLLTTRQVADWLGCSTIWLEIGRGAKNSYGPRFVKISARMVRYRKSDVLEWLRSRTFSSTAEYA